MIPSRRFIVGASLTCAFFSATSAAAQECDDHPDVDGVTVWNATGSSALIRDTVEIGGRCFYYVETEGAGDGPLVLEFQTTAAVKAVHLGTGTSSSELEGFDSTTPGVYRQPFFLNRALAAYRFTLRNADKATLEEVWLYAPRRPMLSLRPPTTGCGGGNCLLRGRENRVQLLGTHLDQIDGTRPAREPGGAELPLVLEDGNWFVLITPSSTLPSAIEIPVRVTVADSPGGSVTLTDRLPVTLSARVEQAREVLNLVPPNSETPLHEVFAGSVTSVRTIAADFDFVVDKQYAIVETPQDTAAPLATLTRYSQNDGWLLSRLRVMNPSRLPRLPGDPPLVYIMDGHTVVATTTLAVLPRPRIEKTEVVRGSAVSTDLYLHPQDTAEVFISGPSVNAFRSAQTSVAGMEATLTQPIPGRVRVVITTPRVAVPFYDLRLATDDGLDTVIRFETRPQQRPRSLDFATIHWAAGNTGGKSLESLQEVPPLPSLEGVRLVFDPTAIDDSATVYGVQYLLLKARLVDHTGAVVDSTVHRIAVTPVGDLPYTVRAGYVQTAEVDVDALLSESTLHTKAHSRLLLSVQHDPERYASSRPPAPVVVQMLHHGRIVVEPSFTLPTGVYVVADGFSPQIATMLSGAFLDFTYFPFADRRRPLPLNLRLGIIAVDPTFLPEGQRRAKLAPTALLNYTVATVRRNLSLSVSAGGMYLNRHTASHLLEEEDFFLLFSPGLTYTIK